MMALDQNSNVPQADPNSQEIQNLNKLAEHYATNSDYNKAIEYFQKMTTICRKNGGAWTALGHCYLLKEDLQKAFQAYQNALYHLDNIMDPQLWYGIGILYEKFESFEHAISSLLAVLKMSPSFYQKSEVLARLGYILPEPTRSTMLSTTSSLLYKRRVSRLRELQTFYLRQVCCQRRKVNLTKPWIPITRPQLQMKITHTRFSNIRHGSYLRVVKGTKHLRLQLQLNNRKTLKLSISRLDVIIL